MKGNPRQKIEQGVKARQGITATAKVNFYESRRGVPLIEVFNSFGDGEDYSVCYFGSTGTWKIFKGYMKFDAPQTKTVVPRFTDVEAFFRGQKYSTTSVQRCASEECVSFVQQPEVLCKRCKRRMPIGTNG